MQSGQARTLEDFGASVVELLGDIGRQDKVRALMAQFDCIGWEQATDLLEDTWLRGYSGGSAI